MKLITSLLSTLFPPRIEAIAELLPGRSALVRGHVVARDLIDSTLTAERCVYYRYSVDEWRETHMAGFVGEGYWAFTRFDEAIVEFYLQDEAGDRLIVAPQHVRVTVASGVTPTHVDMGIAGQRAQELTLKEGDLIEVQGRVTRVRDLFDENRSYRMPPTGLMIGGTQSEALQIQISESASKLP